MITIMIVVRNVTFITTINSLNFRILILEIKDIKIVINFIDKYSENLL